jgi:hypothetical protein
MIESEGVIGDKCEGVEYPILDVIFGEVEEVKDYLQNTLNDGAGHSEVWFGGESRNPDGEVGAYVEAASVLFCLSSLP